MLQDAVGAHEALHQLAPVGGQRAVAVARRLLEHEEEEGQPRQRAQPVVGLQAFVEPPAAFLAQVAAQIVAHVALALVVAPVADAVGQGLHLPQLRCRRAAGPRLRLVEVGRAAGQVDRVLAELVHVAVDRAQPLLPAGASSAR